MTRSGSSDNVGISNDTWTIDGKRYYGETLDHKFDEKGTYTITLTLEDAAGNTDDGTIEVTVEEKGTDGGEEEKGLLSGWLTYLLADGRLVNLVVGQGHPAEIMDMSFALQMLGAEHVVKTDDLEPEVHGIPREIVEKVARLRLKADGIEIDELTDEQRGYVEGCEEAT